MGQSTEAIRFYCNRIMERAGSDAASQINCWVDLGAALNNVAGALSDIYQEVHALRKEIRKIGGRGPIGR